MRHILSVIILLFMLVGCKRIHVQQFDQSEIEYLIGEHIKAELPDNRYYLPLFFTELDSAKSCVEDTPQYQTLQNELNKIDSSFVYDEEAASAIEDQLDELKSKYKPHYIGMELSHAYISSTDFGDSLYVDTYIIKDLPNIQKVNTISTSITQEQRRLFETEMDKDKAKEVYKLFYKK